MKICNRETDGCEHCITAADLESTEAACFPEGGIGTFVCNIDTNLVRDFERQK